jgi:hypothetical protein
LAAVAQVHREALGMQAVWIWDGEIKFADPEMQRLCAGTVVHAVRPDRAEHAPSRSSHERYRIATFFGLF